MWLMDRGKVVERDPSGRPRRIAGTTIDISERKALEQGLIEALNREQRRLSHDLHDGLAKSLTGISLSISGIANKLHNGNAYMKSQLDDVLVALRVAIEETRGLVRGMAAELLTARVLAALA
jgi:signal transduction histidine kinase